MRIHHFAQVEKRIAAAVVEAVDGAHEAQVALLHQVAELEATVAVAPRDGGHQAEVRLDEDPLRRLHPLLGDADRRQFLLEGGGGHARLVLQAGQLSTRGCMARAARLQPDAHPSLPVGEVAKLPHDVVDGSRREGEIRHGDAQGLVRATPPCRLGVDQRPDARDACQEAGAGSCFRAGVVGVDPQEVAQPHLARGEPVGESQQVADARRRRERLAGHVTFSRRDPLAQVDLGVAGQQRCASDLPQVCTLCIGSQGPPPRAPRRSAGRRFAPVWSRPARPCAHDPLDGTVARRGPRTSKPAYT